MENRIKVVLADKKRTNKWLSEQLECAPTTVSKWCTNASQPPMETFVKIAELLEVDINDLLRIEKKWLPAEFNVNLITAFKVDVKVSQSYTNETGGKVGSDIVENIVEKDLYDVAKPSDVVENVVENKENVVENILASISKNSTISTKELAAMCSLSERQVQRIMTKLKEQGVIRRIGPDKGGRWEIIAP